MKIMHLATAIVVGAFAAPALGGIAVHTATGAGGSIPGAGTGGGGTWNNGDPTAMPSSPFESSVEISGGVASVHSITFTDIVHGFIGDLQAVLVDPNGVGYNLFVRPGVGFNNSGFGSGRDFNGTYTFIESGAEFDLPTATGSGLLTTGEYNQTFAGSPTAMGAWQDGSHNVMNTPMSQISGEAGTWTLRVYDWNGGDSGTLDSWTIAYTPIVPTPGALALLGLAGLAGARRRRS